MARAARGWAIAQPACWALLYGSPVPGYHAPAELTVGPGTRVVGALFDVVSAGIDAGDVTTSNSVVAQSISQDFDGIRAEFDFPGDDAAVMKCLVLWAGLVGAISLEVFGQYGADTLTDASAVFDGQVAPARQGTDDAGLRVQPRAEAAARRRNALLARRTDRSISRTAEHPRGVRSSSDPQWRSGAGCA